MGCRHFLYSLTLVRTNKKDNRDNKEKEISHNDSETELTATLPGVSVSLSFRLTGVLGCFSLCTKFDPLSVSPIRAILFPLCHSPITHLALSFSLARSLSFHYFAFHLPHVLFIHTHFVYLSFVLSPSFTLPKTRPPLAGPAHRQQDPPTAGRTRPPPARDGKPLKLRTG